MAFTYQICAVSMAYAVEIGGFCNALLKEVLRGVLCVICRPYLERMILTVDHIDLNASAKRKRQR